MLSYHIRAVVKYESKDGAIESRSILKGNQYKSGQFPKPLSQEAKPENPYFEPKTRPANASKDPKNTQLEPIFR